MNIILLSGGSGKRLWPLSNDIRSKQFIKIFKKEDGTYESMLQRVYRQILKMDRDADITIATSKTQVSAIINQLGDGLKISVEPCRRDTFPAIVLAVSYLHDVCGVPDCDTVVVCPVDPYVEDEYFLCLQKLGQQVEKGEANLVLLGVNPTYPSEKYGYIIPKSKEELCYVDTFKEKPDFKMARKYIQQGALWNSGVFAFKLGYILEKAHKLLDFEDYYDLYNKYETLNKISFDYAVVESEKSIQVIRYYGCWKDLGTWNTLTEEMTDKVMGEVACDDTCRHVSAINELNVPILCMGLKDVIVSASAEGILISDKEKSSYIKPYVDSMEQQVMFAEKSWGKFEVQDIEEDSMTIKITLNSGHNMNYHSHEHRDEVWTIISGKGNAIIDGVEKSVMPGDVVKIHSGCKHTIIAETELKIIEVQLGRNISVHDKIKYKFNIHNLSK